MTEGNDTFCAFIDMHKAFERVDQDLLFYRLLKYNISGNILSHSEIFQLEDHQRTLPGQLQIYAFCLSTQKYGAFGSILIQLLNHEHLQRT